MTNRNIEKLTHNKVISELLHQIFERDVKIKQLVYLIKENKMSYKKYLKTKEWNKIRSKVCSRDKGKCKKCGKKGNEVHHLTYEHIFNEEFYLKDLILLCRECHEKIHFSKSSNNYDNI